MTLPKTILPLIALFLAGVPLSSDAIAQESEPGDGVQALVDELRGELDRGERERLADPWFLRDLRAILDRYDWPWRARILHDEFSGGGPGPDAPWQVTAGEYLIDWRYGLRSVVKPAPAAQSQSQKGQSDDQVKALIGTLLTQAITGEQGGQKAATSEGPTFAAMIAPVPVSNAFAIEAELTSRPVDGASEGRFELGPYQGEGANAGYRLAIVSGAPAGAHALELLRVSPRGTVSTLEFHDQPLALQDEQAHRLTWTRDRTGAMVVQWDGQTLIETVDRGYRDPFDGLAVINSGGDFALRRVTIDGTE